MDNYENSRQSDIAALSSINSMPASIEAEQAVLGALLMDSHWVVEVMDTLRPECFYVEHHRQIYNAIRRLFQSGGRVDAVTVLNELVTMGDFTEEFGIRYLRDLAEMMPLITSDVTAHVRIIREKFERRSLIEAARAIAAEASDESNNMTTLLDRAEQRIFEISNDRTAQGLVPLSEVMVDALDHLMLMNSDRREEFLGIPSGLKALDDTISGLNKSDLIILAARPGMGKTSFALNIARNVAVQQKRAVAFFSLEMTREQLALRILSSESGIDSHKLRDGTIAEDEWPSISDAANRLQDAVIYIDESSNITVTEMKAKLRRKKDVGLVIIDYLQLMNIKNTGNRAADVGELSRSLKIMAKELNVPVICLSQLNRMAEGRKEHKPQLSDLREIG
ncbi:MAG: replicative DNA helicase, partial [Ruminococcaceae bacterium]|nr:replicative DNA helicase [Oscillospiraceae bacterium]